jgi:hypothetical protein
VDINHPDQYFTITKEKGKKMPRFNDSSWQKFVDNIHRNASAKDKYIGIYNMNQTVQHHVSVNKRRDKRKDKTQETKRIKQTVSNVTTLR